jgi:predicted RND superfamily exporter protein/CRP-like cAMP-binding protein
MVNGLPRLQMDAGYNSLIDPTSPEKQVYDESVKLFGSDYMTLIYLRDEKLFTTERLADIEELTFAIQELDFVERVDSIFTAANMRNVEGDLDSTPLMEVVPETQEEIDLAYDNALKNPFVIGNYLSKDQKAAVINVIIKPLWGDDGLPKLAFQSVEDLIVPLQAKFEEVIQIGPPRIITGTKMGMGEDMTQLTPIAAGILVIFTIVFLRTPVAPLLPLMTAGLSIVWTFGFMGWVGIPINMLSAGLPALLIAVGSTEDTHMLSGYLRGIPMAGKNIRYDATRIMLRKIGLPTILTAGTTALGFGATAISEIALLQDFGLATAAGMIFNLIATLLVVPLFMSLVGPKKSNLVKDEGDLDGIFGFVERKIEQLVESNAKTIVISALIVCVICAGLATTLKPQNDPISFLNPDNPIVKATELMHRDVSGVQSFQIVLKTGQKGAFKRSDNLKVLQKIQKYLEYTGDYDKSISLADHVSYVHREWSGEEGAKYEVPDDSELISQYLLFFNRGDMENFVTSDFSTANIIVRHNLLKSTEILTKLEILKAEIQKITEGKIPFDITSQNLLIHGASIELINGQIISFGFVVMVILALITIMYTSIPLGLVSLIPNIMPALVTFGTMVIFDFTLNAGTVLVAVVALGIAIDDTIHLLTSYSANSKGQLDTNVAARKALKSQVIGVMATSVSLSATFLVFTGSNFSVISEFGTLCAVALTSAMIADLVVTPVLLRHVRLVSIWDLLALDVGTEALNQSPLFKGMSKFQIRKVILLCDLRDYSAGEYVIEQDTMRKDMFVLVKGNAEVRREVNGEEKVLARLKEGDVFGEVSFTGNYHTSASIIATDDIKAVRLDKDQVERSLYIYPYITTKLYRNISTILGGRLLQTINALSGREDVRKQNQKKIEQEEQSRKEGAN